MDNQQFKNLRCATCKHLTTQLYKGCASKSTCDRLDVERGGALSTWESIEIVLIDNFACIYHSEINEN